MQHPATAVSMGMQPLCACLWKSVHVPGLTFANAILCLSANTREWLERGKRAAGRLALGCHGRVAVEAIQGDIEWSAFEAREAQSKIAYEARLRNMDDTRWDRKLFRYIHIVGIRTQWCARVQTLRRKYGFLARAEDEAAELGTPSGKRPVECECAEKDHDGTVLRAQGRNLRGATIR
ncbi:hypothetical protein HPB52_023568 [Rhipicephalus sanguineus]|uniref:Tick transposon n=1 Tax=Rhipicephalus sanguineus TaxID=34632 RepID=A0A9D4PER2_RHISA|nr:hypothetical protein HPB52_023568 [Rhipicephalus sanguineus]